MISRRVHAVMQVLFGIFLFLYFYFLQAPLLELAQHQLSEGKTVYYPIVSALVLAAILVLMQHLISKWIHFKDALCSMSYLPSVALGLLLTSFTPHIHVLTVCVCAVLFFVFLIAVLINAKLTHEVFQDKTSFVQVFVHHVVGMVCIFSLLGIFSNNNDVLTYEVKAAHLIREGQYDEALQVGKKSLATSPRLTALRAMALSCSAKGIGDSMFGYPLSEKGASQLLFSPADTLAQVLSPDSLYTLLGGWRSERESPADYFLRMAKKSGDTIALDYRLIALMMDKNLAQFAKELLVYCADKDSVSLPRYYQEALVIYSNEQPVGIPFMGDSICIENFEAYKQYGDTYSNPVERKNQLRRKYGDTYWWFYEYQE